MPESSKNCPKSSKFFVKYGLTSEHTNPEVYGLAHSLVTRQFKPSLYENFGLLNFVGFTVVTQLRWCIFSLWKMWLQGLQCKMTRVRKNLSFIALAQSLKNSLDIIDIRKKTPFRFLASFVAAALEHVAAPAGVGVEFRPEDCWVALASTVALKNHICLS